MVKNLKLWLTTIYHGNIIQLTAKHGKRKAYAAASNFIPAYQKYLERRAHMTVYGTPVNEIDTRILLSMGFQLAYRFERTESESRLYDAINTEIDRRKQAGDGGTA